MLRNFFLGGGVIFSMGNFSWEVGRTLPQIVIKLSAKKKKDLKEHELTPLLCQHEVTRLQEEEEWYVKDAKREVPKIKPLSEKMKEWFPI